MQRIWLIYALITTILWGIWGAFTGLSAQRGFPDTLVYCVWSLTMIAPALFVLARAGWKLERDSKSVLYGMIIGLLGAGGQMILFYTVTIGPTYLIFPIISLSPIITIMLSYSLLRERTNWVGVIGIILALIALPMFDYSAGNSSEESHGKWFILSLIIMLAWGLQAYFMKSANKRMSAESIFFYMMIGGLLLAPVAAMITDWSKPINWRADGPWLAAAIQLLNAIGALTLVYAFRFGKAIVVSPLANAGAPLMTAIISLTLLGVVPATLKLVGLALATIAALLLAMTPEEDTHLTRP
jgi:drug/metabolite transporter (DMT)-like permease